MQLLICQNPLYFVCGRKNFNKIFHCDLAGRVHWEHTQYKIESINQENSMELFALLAVTTPVSMTNEQNDQPLNTFCDWQNAFTHAISCDGWKWPTNELNLSSSSGFVELQACQHCFVSKAIPNSKFVHQSVNRRLNLTTVTIHHIGTWHTGRDVNI